MTDEVKKRGPGRPKKEVVASTKKKEVVFPASVRQIVRFISKKENFGQEASWPAASIDEYLASWLNQGYTLFNTHYLGENPEGYGVLYILIKK